MSFTTRDVTPRIGTEVAIEKAALINGEHAAELRELLEQRGVLIFKKIHLTDDDQRAFAATMGTILPQGEDGVMKVTLDPEQNATAEYLRGNIFWHIDGFSDDMPAKASILSGRVLSEWGGQTQFANTYAAWADVAEERKNELYGLRVAHTMEAAQSKIYPDATDEQRARWASFSPKIHPLVWNHVSGRRSLVLASSMSHVEGMDLPEGRALLDELFMMSTDPQYVYSHEWDVGDVVMWDNTGTMHRVEPFEEGSPRMMHRTTLAGEEALV